MNDELRRRYDEELVLALTKKPSALAYEPFRQGAAGVSRPALYRPKKT